MFTRMKAVVAAALLLVVPMTSHAALTPYAQDFEGLVQADPAALTNDGWIVYGNVFTPAFAYLYGYGPFPAPNGGPAFSAIDVNQGGPTQGVQQLSIYNDYNNAAHGQGNWVEANVYHEQTIAASDVHSVWRFSFDAKLGNLATPSTAIAFLKTLDPSAGYATTNFFRVDMTGIPTIWARYELSITVDPSLAGQLMQFGFASTATSYIGSGVFYDNIVWEDFGRLDAPGSPRTASLELRAPSPNPCVSSARLDYSVARAGFVDVSIYDVTGRRVATLVRGEVSPGPNAATWDGHDGAGRPAAPGVYRAVLQTAAGMRTRNLVLTR